MAKIKLTKNELKKQKDELKMYRRYLPTLMLKKQQLQMEIRTTEARIRELRAEKERVDESFKSWIAVFGETGVFVPGLLRVTELRTAAGNIAGVEIPVFKGAEFEVAPYNLFATPPWLDAAVDRLRKVLLLDLEAATLEEQRRRLERELRTTTQRVNLFEKVKIPEARANIKKIRVYLGDQQTASVVRGKIAKRGMEKAAT
jgi:V/A-type H+-transporting ATPase subunit D